MLGTTKRQYNNTLPHFPSFDLPDKAYEVL